MVNATPRTYTLEMVETLVFSRAFFHSYFPPRKRVCGLLGMALLFRTFRSFVCVDVSMFPIGSPKGLNATRGKPLPPFAAFGCTSNSESRP